MPALTILAPPGASDFDLGGVNGHDLNAEPMKKQIEFAAATTPRRASSTMQFPKYLGRRAGEIPSCRMIRGNSAAPAQTEIWQAGGVSITISAAAPGVITKDLVFGRSSRVGKASTR